MDFAKFTIPKPVINGNPVSGLLIRFCNKQSGKLKYLLFLWFIKLVFIARTFLQEWRALLLINYFIFYCLIIFHPLRNHLMATKPPPPRYADNRPDCRCHKLLTCLS